MAAFPIQTSRRGTLDNVVTKYHFNPAGYNTLSLIGSQAGRMLGIPYSGTNYKLIRKPLIPSLPGGEYPPLTMMAWCTWSSLPAVGTADCLLTVDSVFDGVLALSNDGGVYKFGFKSYFAGAENMTNWTPTVDTPYCITYVGGFGWSALYVNGVFLASLGATNTRARMDYTSSLRAGSGYYAGDYYYHQGLIGTVAIWKRVLSEGEIRELATDWAVMLHTQSPAKGLRSNATAGNRLRHVT